MIYLFGVVAFLFLIGFILLNLNVCRFFHQKMQELDWEKKMLKYFDIVAVIFGILPVFLLLPFCFLSNEKFFLFSMLSLVVFMGIIGYYNYKIYEKNQGYSVWWRNFGYFDKLFFSLLFILVICVYFYNHSFYSVLRLMCLNIFFIYILFLKRVKKQNQIFTLISNKYIKFIEIIICNLFYYLCWVMIGIYILSMSMNIALLYSDTADTDGCLDTGICKEGYTFDDCGDGLPCIVTKENCLKDNNIWFEDIRSCDIRHKAFLE